MPDPTPVETPYGTLYVDPEELVIGRLLQADGKIPDISQEVAFFQKYLRPGDTAIDVGANYGLFTLALFDLVGEDGAVIMFEPNDAVALRLAKTLGAKKTVKKFALHSTAVGRHRGWGYIRLDPRGSGGTQIVSGEDIEDDRTIVHIDTLDDIVHQHNRPIKAIKIDAEGMDVDVLLGAKTILKEDRPAVIFEWNPEAMESLGRDPTDEVITLLNLMERVKYDLVDLNQPPFLFGPVDGKAWPERLLGNMGLLPEELLD